MQTTKHDPPREKMEKSLLLEPSRYLEHLPDIYSEDEFTGRFLRIFEDILEPIGQVIEHSYVYFDPLMAPERLLPWLASWLDLSLDEEWPLEKRRRLIGAAVHLYQLRGTLRGLREYLGIYCGVQPAIVEHHDGFRLSATSRLGWNTVLGDGRGHFITVELRLNRSSHVKIRKVKAIVESQKPAHVAYQIKVIYEEDEEGRPVVDPEGSLPLG